MKHLFLALRPNQWTKNALVLAAFVFAYWDAHQDVAFVAGLLRSVGAAGLFCLVSSAVYLLNDIRDIDADRQHPEKCKRQIAAGHVSVGTAATTAVLLFCLAGTLAWMLAPTLFAVLASYVILQVFYTLALKKIALVDVFMIAIGFVMRALAGAVVLDVTISKWLLMCTFMLALFLGLCKRRHEKGVLQDSSSLHRANLSKYDEHLIDQLIAIVSAATIVCYAIYTLWAETQEKFGTDRLAFTVPFVMFGIFRYLDLVYRHEKGGRPEKILLTDKPLIACVVAYGISVVAIFMTKG